jgi:hypothetical protein
MVAACGVTHPVSPSRTNVQAAPSAANDILITDFPQPRKGWYETGIPHGTMRL